MAKKKFYVVWKGRKTGIFTSWMECEAQVKGYVGAKFKSYPTREEAERALKGEQAQKKTAQCDDGEIEWDSISVDVGCRGNPGIVEYKGVDTKTGEILFAHDEIKIGTNNMGEFLAIVHGLAYLHKQGSHKTIYSDSLTAIKWVKQKKAKSTLERNLQTEYIWSLMDRAEHWLQTNQYENEIKKWHTEKWGEIKADYGRKS
ncbi:ribonuclease H [Halalkalibacter sp. AB-rgal2]|uniref:Ribonuclease H n=1 Tax=Halalkalibacter hemicellulosilyticusJCM 9152 TaxID=1236971 RepID=W4QGQ8_9BACI|nr:ribonuclease H family protein [Halalkalibacter hemicellulosilyticus]GAE31102.1 ribonuclease HI-related protein 3 [Halalkalibacter hemicellulosilyticusJCM 9152]